MGQPEVSWEGGAGPACPQGQGQTLGWILMGEAISVVLGGKDLDCGVEIFHISIWLKYL